MIALVNRYSHTAIRSNSNKAPIYGTLASGHKVSKVLPVLENTSEKSVAPRGTSVAYSTAGGYDRLRASPSNNNPKVSKTDPL